VNTDWLTSAPPPSSWRKKPTDEAPSPAPTTSKKPNLELNPQINPESTWESAGTFRVGDGGAAWSRTTSYDPNFKSSREFSSSSERPSHQGGARWKKDEFRSEGTSSAPPPPLYRSINSTPIQEVPVDDELLKIDLNQLKSQIMKAKLQKKLDLVSELESKLERARHVQSGYSTSSSAATPSHIRIIDDLDEQGRSRGATTSQLAGKLASQTDGKRSNPRTSGLHSESGERLKYFADDDDVDLDTMVARERLEKRSGSVQTGGGILSMDRHYADNVMRKRNYKDDQMFEKHYDGDGDVDYGQWESREKKLSSEELARREKSRAVQASQKFDKATENCYYCLKTKRIPAHLIVSMGHLTSLVLPEKGHLMPGHVTIVPHEHFSSCTSMEDSVWSEIMQFMIALTKYYEREGKEPVFCETVLDFAHYRHTVVDCFPIAKKDASMAPLFFQKAIRESGSEWATHQKLYEFKLPSKTIRNTVPTQFAYFMVQFGVDSGFAHHIEQKAKFSPNFAKEVIGGILELPEETYTGHPRRRSYDYEIRQVDLFKKGWKEFDWTRALY
jgi:hypothetical protein